LRIRGRILGAFEPAVELVEVTEHLAPQIGNLPVELVKTAVDLFEAVGNDLKALINLGEPAPAEFDQLFMLARSHGAMLTVSRGPAQAYSGT
jgi:hypothetical protein